MPRHHLRRPAAALLTGALLAAGCGSGSGSDGDAASPGTEPAATAAPGAPAAEADPDQAAIGPSAGSGDVEAGTGIAGDEAGAGENVPPGGADLTGVDPCGLLDRAAIETVVGSPVAAVTPSSSTCSWSGTSGSGVAVAVALPANPGSTVDDHCQQLREFDAKLTEVTEIEGLGTNAWVHTVPGGAVPGVLEAAVTVCLDSGAVVVGLVAPLDEATMLAATQALASEVVQRLATG